MKNHYFEETRHINYKLKKLMLIEKSEETIIRGLEQIWHNLRELSGFQVREFEEKMRYSENQLQQKKLEIAQLQADSSKRSEE